MRNGRRWRLGALVAASVVGHLGILSVLATTHVRQRTYEPGPVFEVTIAPRIVEPILDPPARPRQQLRPRPSRLRPDDLSVAPLFVPEARPPAPPAPTPPSLTPQLSATLRRGLGCANIGGIGLTQAERDACLERLGQGARDVAALPLGTPAAKQADFDRMAAHKEACRKYREGMPPGLQPAGETSMPSGLGGAPALRGGPC